LARPQTLAAKAAGVYFCEDAEQASLLKQMSINKPLQRPKVVAVGLGKFNTGRRQPSEAKAGSLGETTNPCSESCRGLFRNTQTRIKLV